jgi:hypothetical protein
MRCACVLALAMFAVGAGAPAGPLLRPTRDVDVTYQLESGNGVALQERLRWGVAAGSLRIDPPTPGLYVIIDLRKRRMSMVRTSDHVVIEAPAPPNAAGVPEGATANAKRVGEDQVAGLPCANWAMTDMAGQPTTVCVTDDGVLLRAESDGRTVLAATTVRYGAVDPAAFQLPAGYARRQLDGQR